MKCHVRPRITNIKILMMLMFLSKTLLRCRNAAIPPAFLCSHLDSQRNTTPSWAARVRCERSWKRDQQPFVGAQTDGEVAFAIPITVLKGDQYDFVDDRLLPSAAIA